MKNQTKKVRRDVSIWGIAALAAVTLAALAAGCSREQILSATQGGPTCSQRRLELSASVFNEARKQMARHFRERSNMSLHYAYYLSGDAIQLARATRGCPDFSDAVQNQAINLIRSARLVRTLAVTNMRDPDPLVTQSLLQDRYAELFINRDIE
ncbi:MAG TPA: hypothetical protein VF678_03345 [bacterium]